MAVGFRDLPVAGQAAELTGWCGATLRRKPGQELWLRASVPLLG